MLLPQVQKGGQEGQLSTHREAMVVEWSASSQIVFIMMVRFFTDRWNVPVLLYYITNQRVRLLHIVLYYIMVCCDVLYCIVVLCSVVLCYVVQCCIVFNCVVLYCILLYCLIFILVRHHKVTALVSRSLLTLFSTVSISFILMFCSFHFFLIIFNLLSFLSNEISSKILSFNILFYRSYICWWRLMFWSVKSCSARWRRCWRIHMDM